MPAKLVEARLKEVSAAAMARDPDRYGWYRLGSANPWLCEAPENDWGTIARVSVDGDEQILGHMAAFANHDCNVVTGLSAISFAYGAPSMAFLRDLGAFLDELLASFYWVRFSVAVGNPAELIWRRAALRRGGVDKGVWHRYGKTWRGVPIDCRFFEIPGVPEPERAKGSAAGEQPPTPRGLRPDG